MPAGVQTAADNNKSAKFFNILGTNLSYNSENYFSLDWVFFIIESKAVVFFKLVYKIHAKTNVIKFFFKKWHA